MPQYSEEFKEQTVRKLMPPNSMSVAQVQRETGVSDATLYNWRNRFRHEGNGTCQPHMDSHFKDNIDFT